MSPPAPAIALVIGLVLTVGCAGTGERRAWIDNDVGLHYELRGSGPMALVIPGASWMDADLGDLRPPGRTVLYDPRGRGRSPAGEDRKVRIEHDVADLEALRVFLGIERLSLLGWSYYGGLCVRYALAYPQRVERLVLVAPLPARRSPHWNEFMRRFGERVDPQALARLESERDAGRNRSDPQTYCRRFVATYWRTYCADEEDAALIASDPCRLPNLDPDAAARLGQEILADLGNWDWRPELARLSVPTLLVHGVDDLIPIAASSEYAELLPDAELLQLSDAGHVPWVEQPAAFFAGVNAFLEGNGPDSR